MQGSGSRHGKRHCPKKSLPLADDERRCHGADHEADLLMAMYGRHGECPLVVLAAAKITTGRAASSAARAPADMTLQEA